MMNNSFHGFLASRFNPISGFPAGGGQGSVYLLMRWEGMTQKVAKDAKKSDLKTFVSFAIFCVDTD
jgi:hypothetical protein